MKLLPTRRRTADRVLRDALTRADPHAVGPTGSPTAVQLLGQISGREDWSQIRDYWTRRSGLTGSWPTRLGPSELVLNLWPIRPGHLQLATGIGMKAPRRQPRRLLGTPALISFDAKSPRSDALARAIASWLDDVIEHGDYPGGFALAPPILEEWAPRGRLVSREVVTFGLAWQLEPPEGVTWSREQ
jgi:hypothetical protein